MVTNFKENLHSKALPRGGKSGKKPTIQPSLLVGWLVGCRQTTQRPPARAKMCGTTGSLETCTLIHSYTLIAFLRSIRDAECAAIQFNAQNSGYPLELNSERKQYDYALFHADGIHYAKQNDARSSFNRKFELVLSFNRKFELNNKNLHNKTRRPGPNLCGW